MSNSLIKHYVGQGDRDEYEELTCSCPKEMDDRCLLGLHSLPDNICYAAVRRLQSIKNAGRELSEEEISLLPGCPWAIKHQKSNYCFFKYLKDYIADNSPSDQEMAHMLSCSIQDIKNAEKSAMIKVKNSDMVNSLRNNFDACEIVEGRAFDVFFNIMR